MNEQEQDQTAHREPGETPGELGEEQVYPGTEAEEVSPAPREPRTRGFFSRVRSGRLFGSFTYVYFGLFVIFHVAVALVFLMTSMNPLAGLVLWIIMMLLGGLTVVALSLWRDHLHTYWDH
ncbi:MAG: hypothetical protein WD049_04020 [Candidatus Paceibacterota bacterium]